MSFTYVHRDIRDILDVRLTNLAFQSRTVGAPVTTDGGPLQRTYGSFYDGKYDGFIVAIDKRFRNRYQVQANYTYSKATDNLLNSNLGLGLATQGGGAVPTDNLDLELDRGSLASRVDEERSFGVGREAALVTKGLELLRRVLGEGDCPLLSSLAAEQDLLRPLEPKVRHVDVARL